MSQERTPRARDVFDEALDQPPAQRGAFVAAACADDPAVGAQVQELLEAFDRGEHVLEPVSTASLGRGAATTAAGRIIGHYRLRRLIGSGGMGSVYEATQIHPRRTVALKLIKQGISSRSALRRFEYETQILAHLRHPGIAQIYEAGMHDDDDGGTIPYFAMEYIPSAKGLTEYAAVQKLGTRQKLELFAAICDAVHHGHQRGIIHRDLKPSNILVDSEGHAKIIDFGVARATDSDLAVTTLHTDIGQLVGTVQYMSPEQCAADPHDLDTRSDVYSLGVVLYEMLCEQLPYDLKRTPIHEATRIIREQPPSRPSRSRRALRGDVETIVLKALEKQRGRRYQSAAELAVDIRRYLKREAILARPPSVTYQMSMFARRNKAAAVAMASVFAVLLVTTLVISLLLVRAERERAEKEKLAQDMTALAKDAIDLFTGQLDRAVVTADRNGDIQIAVSFLEDGETQLRERLANYSDLTVEGLNGLGAMYKSIGEFERAEELTTEALALARKTLDADDPLILLVQLQLATVYRAATKHEMAEKAYLEVIANDRRRQGAGSSSAWENLSDMYLDLGRADEAETLLDETIDGIRSREGRGSASAAYYMTNLAGVYRVQERYADADRLLSEALELCARNGLLENDIGFRTIREQARLRLAEGRLEEARLLQQHALSGFRGLGYEFDLNPLLALELGALIDLEDNHVEEARAGFIAAANAAGNSLQSEHKWWAANFRVGEARCLAREGRYDEAERVLLAAHADLDKRLGQMHHRTQKCITALAELYRATSRPEEEAVWRALIREGIVPARVRS